MAQAVARLGLASSCSWIHNQAKSTGRVGFITYSLAQIQPVTRKIRHLRRLRPPWRSFNRLAGAVQLVSTLVRVSDRF